MNNRLIKILEPNLPENPNQSDFIIAYLLTGRVLTRFDSVYKFGFFEAPARVSELKSKGWPIKSTEIKIQTQLGKVSSCVIWYLDINRAQEIGLITFKG